MTGEEFFHPPDRLFLHRTDVDNEGSAGDEGRHLDEERTKPPDRNRKDDKVSPGGRLERDPLHPAGRPDAAGSVAHKNAEISLQVPGGEAAEPPVPDDRNRLPRRSFASHPFLWTLRECSNTALYTALTNSGVRFASPASARRFP